MRELAKIICQKADVCRVAAMEYRASDAAIAAAQIYGLCQQLNAESPFPAEVNDPVDELVDEILDQASANVLFAGSDMQISTPRSHKTLVEASEQLMVVARELEKMTRGIPESVKIRIRRAVDDAYSGVKNHDCRAVVQHATKVIYNLPELKKSNPELGDEFISEIREEAVELRLMATHMDDQNVLTEEDFGNLEKQVGVLYEQTLGLID